jgi:hypothetical protein
MTSLLSATWPFMKASSHPIGRGTPKVDVYMVGYYAPEQRVNPGVFLGVGAGQSAALAVFVVVQLFEVVAAAIKQPAVRGSLWLLALDLW